MTNITKALDELETATAFSSKSARDNHAKNIAALRAALQDKAGEDATIEDNSQQWVGMDGATAWLLINRHADGWGDVDKMMSEWLTANTRHAPVVPDDALRWRVQDLLHLLSFAKIETPTPTDKPEAEKAMADIRAMLAASRQKGGQ